MKSLLSLVFLAILTTGSMSFADSQDLKKFPITSGQLNTAQFAGGFQSGELVIDQATERVFLTINNDVKLELPIVETHIGSCGATIMTARLVDSSNGSTDELVIKDNTTIICRILMPSKGTAVLKSNMLSETGIISYESQLVLEGRNSKLENFGPGLTIVK